MSTENQINATDAQNLLFSQVYVPQFLQKLASLGVNVQTEEQAHSLLRQAHMLRAAEAEAAVKQAAVVNDPLLVAERRLQTVLAKQAGVNDPEISLAYEEYAGQVAAQRPDLVKAAVAYQDALAAAMVQQAS